MYGSIAANKRNTVLIMVVFVAIIAAIGYVVSLYFGNTSIALWVIAGAAIYAFIQYYAATKLTIAMTGAKEIEKRDNPRLYRMVENLAITTGMPMPKVYIIDDPAPNAFATGRDPKHAIVAATTGILELMDDSELEGVMAHELGHVQNYDIRVSMMAFGLVSAIGLISDLVLHALFFSNSDNRNVPVYFYAIAIVIVILAPIMAAIIQMAISRQREYLADGTGAMTTRNPEGLASALEKLQQHGQPMKAQSSSTAHLFFSNPLKKGFLSGLFSTHPPLEERIARLRKNADKF
ncbi:MAG: protease [Chloroflexi bacterium]|nr:MAG: protease [Chloroflexota bacterium]